MRVLGLMSGGIDGRIASALLEASGLVVQWVHFETGFAPDASRARLREWESRADAPRLTRIDVRAEYLDRVVVRPRFGTPFAHPPCIDCRILMLSRARELADATGCEGLFTGDVLGQGGPAQGREALMRIDREAGVEGRVLRPLSAAKLSWPARWERTKVEPWLGQAIHGRGRAGIADLAGRLGLDGVPLTKGGCCLLADAGFRRRLRDALEHRIESLEPTHLLEFTRHFRLSWNAKCVVSRNAEEGAALERDPADGWLCRMAKGGGALAKILGTPDSNDYLAAASLVVRLSQPAALRSPQSVEFLASNTSATTSRMSIPPDDGSVVAPATDEEVALWRI